MQQQKKQCQQSTNCGVSQGTHGLFIWRICIGKIQKAQQLIFQLRICVATQAMKQKSKSNNKPRVESAGAFMVLAFEGLHWPNAKNAASHFHKWDLQVFLIATKCDKKSTNCQVGCGTCGAVMEGLHWPNAKNATSHFHSWDLLFFSLRCKWWNKKQANNQPLWVSQGSHSIGILGLTFGQMPKMQHVIFANESHNFRVLSLLCKWQKPTTNQL